MTKKYQIDKSYHLHYIKGLENLFWYLDIDFKPYNDQISKFRGIKLDYLVISEPKTYIYVHK